jgi:hypothetical protein
MKPTTQLAAAASVIFTCAGAHAQTQIIKPPVAQVWMDLATYSMMGMDEMPEMPPGMGMLGNLMGTSAHTGRDGKRARGVGNFGQTKSAGMGRQLDIALVTQLKPSGTSAIQQMQCHCSWLRHRAKDL